MGVSVHPALNHPERQTDRQREVGRRRVGRDRGEGRQDGGGGGGEKCTSLGKKNS